MEMQNFNPESNNNFKAYEASRNRGKVVGGILLIVIGSLFLFRELGVDFPRWLFSWKILLIGIGIVLGFKHQFKSGGWFIPIIVGLTFLLIDWFPILPIKQYVWPSIIILVGVFLIFKPKRRNPYKNWKKYERWNERHNFGYQESSSQTFDNSTAANSEDTINSSTFMGGVKKNIISKNFKGGEISNVFGGAEINLSQADFEGSIKLEVNQVFGGTTLIVPANWQINSELTSIFGSIDDKRPVVPQTGTEQKKILLLEGNTVFGGIEIKSY